MRGFIWGGCAWFYSGGVRGFIWGVCVVLSVFSDTMRYGQWAGSTHPTGMHSCSDLFWWIIYGWNKSFVRDTADSDFGCDSTWISKPRWMLLFPRFNAGCNGPQIRLWVQPLSTSWWPVFMDWPLCPHAFSSKSRNSIQAVNLILMPSFSDFHHHIYRNVPIDLKDTENKCSCWPQLRLVA